MSGLTYMITITNSTPGSFAFSGTKQGSSQGNYTGDNFPEYDTFCLNIPVGPDPLSNIHWQYCKSGGINDPVAKISFWTGSISSAFPIPPGGFKNNDCLIILNMTDNMVKLSVLQETGISAGTVVSNDLIPANDMKFVKFTSAAAPEFTDKACCVHPDTMVQTPTGQKIIKDLKKGDEVITANGETVPLSFNIKGVTSKHFVNIPAHSLAKNVPDRDLIIKGEHPILFNGKEIAPQKLMKRDAGEKLSNITLKKPEHVWSLCTKDRRFVMMNNVPVCTWSEKCWEEMNEMHPGMYWTTQ